MLIALAMTTALLGQAPRAAAQDNPVLRERLEQKIVEELSTHNSQETAWYNERSVNKQSWTKGKLLGRPIRLASWTEETKTWVWLEDPARSLSLDLKSLGIRGGRVEFALTARSHARFKASGRIPKLAKAAVGGVMDIDIEIAGSAAIAARGLTDAKITTFNGRLHDLRFNNDAAHPFEDLAKDALNRYIDDHNDKLCRSMEKAIDRVKF
jgi:hypothetical protein